MPTSAIIKNKKELVSHGNKELREIAIDIVEESLQVVHSYNAIKRMVTLDSDNKIHIENSEFGPQSYEGGIYVIAAGKASLPMAAALDDILGQTITKGVAVLKEGQEGSQKLKNIEVVSAGHPVPNEAGLRASKVVLDIAIRASKNKNSLVFCLISGGATAMLPLPIEDVSFEDVAEVTRLLLDSGANVNEINSIRYHISSIGGGKLALRIHPAQVISIVISDELDSNLWGPTIPDNTSFNDALMVLSRYDLRRKVPKSILNYLTRGSSGDVPESPKDADFIRLGLRHYDFILADNSTLCEACLHAAEKRGFKSFILSTKLEGESRDAGMTLASIALEIQERGRPLSAPCVLIAGGENTVKLFDTKRGRGGPSQEFALGVAKIIAEKNGIVAISLDTDGTDGVTEFAGAIVDGWTKKRADEAGPGIEMALQLHDSSTLLSKLGDTIMTGVTGTNVMDLNVFLIS